MTDKMTPEQRHRCMSRIRSRDTGPEMAVRRYLWSHGVRYRVCRRDLPGSPDIVIGRLRAVIFIHGCFWHGHECHGRSPRTNTDFWRAKIERNRERDFEVGVRLRQLGWHVITVWECELSRTRREATLRRLLATLQALEKVPKSPSPYSYPEADPLTAAEPEW